VLRLQTLGNVFVAADSGEPLGGVAAQRRTLALLAALAIAGEAGLSRDKIVGLLWPETDPERARHSLTQALYAARRALQADDLFAVNADVRLNRRRLVCDVNELEAALDAGDLELGVALYAGPFLDGFFLSGSPEFEQWSSLQRGRLEGRVAEALERLAEAAEMEGDYRRAAERRKRISAIRPLDSGNAVKLMTALVATGDRAGALQHARVHEALLREQLDLEPDVTVLALAKKLREPSQPIASDARVHGTEPERPLNEAVPGKGSSSPVGFVDSASIRSSLWTAWAPRELWSSRRLPVALILVLAVLAAAIAISRERREVPASAQPQLRQKVVVAPFRVVGAASALDYLSDGLVELLSTRLADDTAARAVDAGAVLGAWESAGFTRAAAVPRDSVVKLAAQLGAERVVIGSVVGTPSRMILRASVVAVPSAQVSGEAMVEGPADSISALIDGLAAKLLVSQAGEDERLASYTTASLPALRAYLAGQAAFRQDDYDGAVRRYEAALELDPRFALAALHLAMAADRRNDDEQRRRGVALAWTSRDALSERDLALLVAFGGPKYPLPSSALEQLAAWRRLADLAPNDAESWYTLGARLFHDGPTAGVPGGESRSTATLERALSIDSDHAPAGLLRLHLATTRRSSSQLDDLVTDTALAGSLKPFAPFIRWRIALARGDTADLRRVRGSLRRLDHFNLRAMAQASQFDGFGIEDGAHALEILRARATRRTERLDLLLAQHSWAVQQGRPQTALTVSTRLGALQLGSHAHLRLRVLDALYAEGDTAAAAGAARELAMLTSGGLAAGTFSSDARLADLCVLSQWRASSGDTAGMEVAIDALRRAATMRYLPPVSAAPWACAELLDGWLAVLMRRGDALTRIGRLDSLALTSQTAGDAITYAPILIARLYERLGQPSRALQAIRKRAYMSSWPRYLATAWREEGRLAQLAGDQAGAEAAYEHYLAFRTSPEDELVPHVEQVRRYLTSLKGMP
jgi:DNA-binding SARP family transcriptional activator/TolB-like protein